MIDHELSASTSLWWCEKRNALLTSPDAAWLKIAVCSGRISDFHEKPTGADLERLKSVSKNATEHNPFEASMGIYVFKRDVLVSQTFLPQNTQHVQVQCLTAEHPKVGD